MYEIVAVFSAVVALTGFMFQIWAHSERKTRETLKEFEADLSNFLDNVLGWYNRIVSFSRPLLEDMVHDKLSKEMRREYSKLLYTIKKEDAYYSKCERFIKLKLDAYLKKAPFKGEVTKRLFDELKWSYENFSEDVIAHKDRMGQLLMRWEDFTPSRKQRAVYGIISDLSHMEAYKEAIVRLLGIKLGE